MNKHDRQNMEKRRRAVVVCKGCRTRKLRCDLMTQRPCTRCAKKGLSCEDEISSKRGRKPRTESCQHQPPVHSVPNQIEEEFPRDHGAGAWSPAVPYLSTPASDASRQQDLQNPERFSNASQARETDSCGDQGGARTSSLRGVPYLPLLECISEESPPDVRGSVHGDAAVSNAPQSTSNTLDGYCIEFLHNKGVFDLPKQPAMDEMVSAYFRIFHCMFPVLDKQAFLDMYANRRLARQCGQDRPSLLLMRSVLFIATGLISSATLRTLGFKERKEARRVYHEKARLLHLLDYEKDAIVTIQALLLISNYFPSSVEHKHTWYWAQQAITLAQCVGLHHHQVGAPQSKLWSRIWWSCIVRDRMISLGTGQPLHINSLDCNIPRPVLEDLQERGDDQTDLDSKQIFIEFIKLCQCMEGVLCVWSAFRGNRNSPESQDVEMCREALDFWYSNLAPPAQLTYTWDKTQDNCDVVAVSRAVLHLAFNAVMISLYHPFHLQSVRKSSVTSPFCEDVLQAASRSTRLVTELVQRDLVRFCPTICVTTIIPPLVVQLLELRSSRSERTRLHKNCYELCMLFLRELGDIYWHADFYHKVFGTVQVIPSVQSGLEVPVLSNAAPTCPRESAANELENNDDGNRQSVQPQRLEQVTSLLDPEESPSREDGEDSVNVVYQRGPNRSAPTTARAHLQNLPCWDNMDFEFWLDGLGGIQGAFPAE